MSSPIHIHPDNPKFFKFREKPLMLLTPTEHYGAVINRPFRYDRYLADAAENNITLTRLFMLFREQQSSINPYSTCKPESPDYISPYMRTGPGRAEDKEPKYDLDRENPEFFERLHDFLSIASDYGIIVEVVLLSNTYGPPVWSLNPLNAANNINGLETIEWPEYMSMRHSDLFERQKAHVKRIVEETNRYDNIVYEICNEPGGNFGGDGSSNPTLDEVNAWLSTLIQLLRETEADLPNRHLVVGQEAFSYEPWEQPSDLTFTSMDYDVVNMHPLPNTTFQGEGFDLGDFMSKQLRLQAFRDYCLATYVAEKPLNLDEDNVASQYKDIDGWTIHRKRAWTALVTGNHYDYIDFSIIPWLETGTPDSQRYIRNWMKYLSQFIHELDIVHGRPLPGIVKSAPEDTVCSAFGVVDRDICIYVADGREHLTARDLPDYLPGRTDAGAPITGELVIDVPEGTYHISLFDPKTGVCSPAVRQNFSPKVSLFLQPFVHDVVVRLARV